MGSSNIKDDNPLKPFIIRKKYLTNKRGYYVKFGEYHHFTGSEEHYESSTFFTDLLRAYIIRAIFKPKLRTDKKGTIMIFLIKLVTSNYLTSKERLVHICNKFKNNEMTIRYLANCMQHRSECVRTVLLFLPIDLAKIVKDYYVKEKVPINNMNDKRIISFTDQVYPKMYAECFHNYSVYVHYEQVQKKIFDVLRN